MTTFYINDATNFKAACVVFANIEARTSDWAEELAALGIVGVDVAPYVTEYVSIASGVTANPSQRGDTLVFKKDSKEYNRVKYIVSVVNGPRSIKSAVANQADPVAKLLKAFNKLDTEQRVAFAKAVAGL